MLAETTVSFELIFLITITAIPIFVLLLCVMCRFICEFSLELRYLNSEIMRADDEDLEELIKQQREILEACDSPEKFIIIGLSCFG